MTLKGRKNSVSYLNSSVNSTSMTQCRQHCKIPLYVALLWPVFNTIIKGTLIKYRITL